MLAIKLNDKTHEIEDNSSVLSVVERFKMEQKGIAIAVNQQIISKSDWSTFIFS